MDSAFVTITLPATSELKMLDLAREINNLAYAVGIPRKVISYDDRWEELGVGEYVAFRASLSDMLEVMRSASEALTVTEVKINENQLSLF